MNLLDHGYLNLIESWGSDQRIVEAARMSTDKGFLGWGPTCKHCGAVKSSVTGDLCCASKIHEWVTGDERLLKYLYEHKHTTPFEMAGMTVEVQAPIFVFREWHRHRTQSYNEMSGRYTPLPDLNYIPSVERLMLNSKTNKQAGTINGADELTEQGAIAFQDSLHVTYADQERVYQYSLQSGVPKELARIHLPVGRYSKMRASANLLNWLKFLTLRMAENAQWEIRQYANAVGGLVAAHFPRTWELFHGSLERADAATAGNG